MTALRKPDFMTVAAFQAWEPDEHNDRRWQLVDGHPVCMAPPSENHGAIQSEAAFLFTAHLRHHRPECRVITTPGIVPRVGSTSNQRIPDLGVTCAPPSDSQVVKDPVLLIEILSPSNEALTRANVWTYTTIPSVKEILLLSSTRIEAEVLQRGPGGDWPQAPIVLGAGDDVTLVSIGLRLPILDFYRTTSLPMRKA